MPWKVSGVVEQRQRFLREYEAGEWTMTELCRAYGISRPTGYELWHRYGNEGAAGLEERSRAPARHPNQTPPASSPAAASAPDTLSVCAAPSACAPAAAPAPALRSPAASGSDAALAPGCVPLVPPRLRFHTDARARTPSAARSRTPDTARSSSTLPLHTLGETSAVVPPLRSLSKACFASTRPAQRIKTVNYVPGLFCKVCARSVPGLAVSLKRYPDTKPEYFRNL